MVGLAQKCRERPACYGYYKMPGALACSTICDYSNECKNNPIASRIVEENCECGNRAMHTIFKDGEKKRLCCGCYIRAGETPADWHPGCMRAAGLAKETVAWHGEPGTERSSLI